MAGRLRRANGAGQGLSGKPRTLGRARIADVNGISEDHPMDKKAKTPKKPKQTKTKDGAAKGK